MTARSSGSATARTPTSSWGTERLAGTARDARRSAGRSTVGSAPTRKRSSSAATPRAAATSRTRPSPASTARWPTRCSGPGGAGRRPTATSGTRAPRCAGRRRPARRPRGWPRARERSGSRRRDRGWRARAPERPAWRGEGGAGSSGQRARGCEGRRRPRGPRVEDGAAPVGGARAQHPVAEQERVRRARTRRVEPSRERRRPRPCGRPPEGAAATRHRVATAPEGSAPRARAGTFASSDVARVATARAAAARTSSLASPASALRSGAPSPHLTPARARPAKALARTYAARRPRAGKRASACGATPRGVVDLARGRTASEEAPHSQLRRSWHGVRVARACQRLQARNVGRVAHEAQGPGARADSRVGVLQEGAGDGERPGVARVRGAHDRGRPPVGASLERSAVAGAPTAEAEGAGPNASMSASRSAPAVVSRAPASRDTARPSVRGPGCRRAP